MVGCTRNLPLIYLDYLLISFNEENVIYFLLSTNISYNVPRQSTAQHILIYVCSSPQRATTIGRAARTLTLIDLDRGDPGRQRVELARAAPSSTPRPPPPPPPPRWCSFSLLRRRREDRMAVRGGEPPFGRPCSGDLYVCTTEHVVMLSESPNVCTILRKCPTRRTYEVESSKI